jgi:uncharacterized spore protein YtfJ
MAASESIQALFERLQNGASARTVYGEPVTAEGRTVIPVARVGYGFGAGSGTGKKGEEEDEKGGEGFGGGGCAAARPVGVVEITRDGTRFIHFGLGLKLLGAALVGYLFGSIFRRR